MKKMSVKERVITVASKLFYTNGYNQTGINQIIDEAEVAKASLYKHFRSKEDIAVAYLRHRHYWWMGELDKFVFHQSTKEQKLIAVFDFLIYWLKEVDYRGCGFQNILADLPKDQLKIKKEVLFHKNELLRWIQNVLKNETDVLSEIESQLAKEILVLIDGAIIMAQIQNDVWPIEAAKNTCKKLFN